MKLKTPPFWLLPINKNRKVGVANHDYRGLVVLDPAGQDDIAENKIRLYVAKENKLYILYCEHVENNLKLPLSEKQAWLGLRTYKSFLNPKLNRPEQIDVELVTPYDLDWDPEINYRFCESCNGTGQEIVNNVLSGMICSYCNGNGTLK